MRSILIGSVEQAPPFLLLPQANGAPVVRRSKVRLQFTQLTDLPDVEGQYQASCESTLQLICDEGITPEMRQRMNDMPRDDDKLWATFSGRPPQAGVWLPFDIGSVQGAMQLGEDVFEATIYLEQDLPLKPGTRLRRTVTWKADGETKSLDADIATVLE